MLCPYSSEYFDDSILHVVQTATISNSSAIHRSILGTLSRHELLAFLLGFAPIGLTFDNGQFTSRNSSDPACPLRPYKMLGARGTRVTTEDRREGGTNSHNYNRQFFAGEPRRLGQVRWPKAYRVLVAIAEATANSTQ